MKEDLRGIVLAHQNEPVIIGVEVKTIDAIIKKVNYAKQHELNSRSYIHS